MVGTVLLLSVAVVCQGYAQVVDPDKAEIRSLRRQLAELVRQVEAKGHPWKR